MAISSRAASGAASVCVTAHREAKWVCLPRSAETRLGLQAEVAAARISRRASEDSTSSLRLERVCVCVYVCE